MTSSFTSLLTSSHLHLLMFFLIFSSSGIWQTVHAQPTSNSIPTPTGTGKPTLSFPGLTSRITACATVKITVNYNNTASSNIPINLYIANSGIPQSLLTTKTTSSSSSSSPSNSTVSPTTTTTKLPTITTAVGITTKAPVASGTSLTTSKITSDSSTTIPATTTTIVKSSTSSAVLQTQTTTGNTVVKPSTTTSVAAISHTVTSITPSNLIARSYDKDILFSSSSSIVATEDFTSPLLWSYPHNPQPISKRTGYINTTLPSISFPPGTYSTTFTWTSINVPSGIYRIWAYAEDDWNTSAGSGFITVIQGGNVSCLSNLGTQDGSSSNSGGSKGGKTTNTGAIAGGVIGGVLVLLALAITGWWYSKKKRNEQKRFKDLQAWEPPTLATAIYAGNGSSSTSFGVGGSGRMDSQHQRQGAGAGGKRTSLLGFELPNAVTQGTVGLVSGLTTAFKSSALPRGGGGGGGNGSGSGSGGEMKPSGSNRSLGKKTLGVFGLGGGGEKYGHGHGNIGSISSPLTNSGQETNGLGGTGGGGGGGGSGKHVKSNPSEISSIAMNPLSYANSNSNPISSNNGIPSKSRNPQSILNTFGETQEEDWEEGEKEDPNEVLDSGRQRRRKDGGGFRSSSSDDDDDQQRHERLGKERENDRTGQVSSDESHVMGSLVRPLNVEDYGIGSGSGSGSGSGYVLGRGDSFHKSWNDHVDNGGLRKSWIDSLTNPESSTGKRDSRLLSVTGRRTSGVLPTELESDFSPAAGGGGGGGGGGGSTGLSYGSSIKRKPVPSLLDRGDGTGMRFEDGEWEGGGQGGGRVRGGDIRGGVEVVRD